MIGELFFWLAIVTATVIAAWLASWLYSRRWSKPQPRARITQYRGPETGGVVLWRVEKLHFRNTAVYPRRTYWVRWSDALRFANDRVRFEREH